MTTTQVKTESASSTDRDEVKKLSNGNHPQLRPERRSRKRANMHDGIPVWHDCCSCEAEPYWTEME